MSPGHIRAGFCGLCKCFGIYPICKRKVLSFLFLFFFKQLDHICVCVCVCLFKHYCDWCEKMGGRGAALEKGPWWEVTGTQTVTVAMKMRVRGMNWLPPRSGLKEGALLQLAFNEKHNQHT